ncbi:alcohol-forming fatty acyl-CoA reductase-like [Dorcoceras hygrometricum]|uniref:Fatty acyl-CoA reductase n=1 Tax=Dorcoceras hygrometricum TaxID=472368 RepID=A0A2Z7D1L6_9LAMI|nr:alcohol-forming fatty acyl-CoA reductase-like [Dorcoceras hygrometricum]
MELGSILHFLENSCILVTGATGFLAKIFIEKILRVQPNVKRIYVLLRAQDTNAAILRFNTEVISKDLFRVLKGNCGENFDSFLSKKVRVVAGDITCENLGVKDTNLLDEMWEEIDIVVNSAANTNFDERYDTSFKINTLGALHVLGFSKKCPKLKVLLHVSTAYVCGEKGGLIMEKPYKMGETLNGGTSGLHIYSEKKLMEEKLKQLGIQYSSQHDIESAMKDFGIQRARKFGWPNTYVFTKAMGEMVLGQLKENVPVVIIRPTIITSTFKEPFPGWAEGVRTIDSLSVGYGKGKLTCFTGDPESIVDVIPADMVINSMIVAMAANADQPNESIYHVGSSVSNPLELKWFQEYGHIYFSQNPWIDKDGKPVIVGKVKLFDTIDSFHRYMYLHYLLPLKGLEVLNTACCQYFDNIYVESCRKIKFVMRLVDLYVPYLFFKGCFDDLNTEKLRRLAKESCVEAEMFYFDPKDIKWDEYFMKIHIPGTVKYVFK